MFSSRSAHRRSGCGRNSVLAWQTIQAFGLVRHAESCARDLLSTSGARVGGHSRRLEIVYSEARKSSAWARWNFLAAGVLRPIDSGGRRVGSGGGLCAAQSGEGWTKGLDLGLECGRGRPHDSRRGRRRYGLHLRKRAGLKDWNRVWIASEDAGATGGQRTGAT